MNGNFYLQGMLKKLIIGEVIVAIPCIITSARNVENIKELPVIKITMETKEIIIPQGCVKVGNLIGQVQMKINIA